MTYIIVKHQFTYTFNALCNYAMLYVVHKQILNYSGVIPMGEGGGGSAIIEFINYVIWIKGCQKVSFLTLRNL